MTIILFLIDTSASMCQKAHINGVQKSYLDIAKGAVETFLKYRQRSQDCMGDRYMLLTFEDPPCNVKAGWKENHATFMNELKNLQSNNLTSMGEALKNAFDLLNLNRMQSGIDTYGQGRCPYYLEPSVIIIITDGGKYSFRNGVHQDITLPLHAQIPGAKLTKEPFRWDQRLFSLVLRMSGNKLDERVEGKVPHDDSPIEKMCEVTGGRSYKVRTHYVLNQCIESLVQKVQPGVVIHFEPLSSKELKDGEIQDLNFQTMKRMIYVQKHPTQKTFPVGFWPIPEPYWPDVKATNLPQRDAHPKIKILTPCVDEPPTIRNFPIDKYELEPSPLTLQILSKKNEGNKIWPLIVSNGLHGIEMPFGYLKSNSTLTVVHFYILPYNYQTMLPLMNDLFHKHNLNPPNDWMYKFTNYVKSIPQYYCPFIRRALLHTNVPFQLIQYMLPDTLDNYLSATVANQLKQMKNTAKLDQENLCLRVFKQLKQPKPLYHQIETTKLNCGLPLKRDLVTHPMLKDTFSKVHSEINIFENYSIVLPTIMTSISTKNFRNPFDIPRRDLIDEISRMRENFFKIPTNGINLYTKDAGHCLPIAEMGNYQEYLKNKETPLRELEPTNVRQHMFGNPYKKDKHMVMVDEADLGELAPMKASNMGGATPGMVRKLDGTRLGRKRKAGPISKNFKFRRLSTSSDSSYSSSHEGNASSCSTSNSKGNMSPSAHSSTSSFSFNSDIEDDSASETSSIMSDDGEDRLVVDIEFNEPAQMEDFPINGHVQSFINGDIDDIAEVNPNPPHPIAVAPPSILHSASLTPLPQPAFSPIIQQQQQQLQQPSLPVQTPPLVINHSNNIGNTTNFVSPPQQAMSLVNPIVPGVAVSTTQSHGYSSMNDAQEISKILQQCHSSNSNNSNNSNCINTSNNNNNNNANSITNNHHHVNNNSENINNHKFNELITGNHVSYSSNNNVNNKKDDILTVNNSSNTNNKHDIKVKHENSIDDDGNGECDDINDDDDSENNSNGNSNEDVLDEEQKENIKQHNLETRSTVFKDIRRPGRDYSILLDHLSLIKGNFETKFNFVQMCINESLRFRRKKMAASIEEWWEKQIDGLNAS